MGGGNRGKGVLVEKKKGQGVLGKMPFFFLPLESEQREGGGRVGAAGRRQSPANRATAADGRWGKMTRAPREIDSPTYLGLGWCVEAGPRAAADWRWWCSVWRRCRRSGVQ
jgi:hypothetical protein